MIRLLAFSLAMLISSSAFCKDLKPIMDHYYYEVNVTWDQKDMSTLDSINNKFKAQMQAQGFTDTDVMSYIESTTHDANLAQELKMKITMVKNGSLSPEMAQEDMQQYLARSYNRGAAWSGIATAVVGGVVFFAVWFLISSVYVNGQENGDDQTSNNNNSCLLGLGC